MKTTSLAILERNLGIWSKTIIVKDNYIYSGEKYNKTVSPINYWVFKFPKSVRIICEGMHVTKSKDMGILAYMLPKCF